MNDTYYTHVDTPVGPFLVAGTCEGLVCTSFSRGRQVRTPQTGWVEDATPLRQAVEQVEAYLAGDRTLFDLPLAVAGTPFQRSVWALLQTIPLGETWTYGDLARALGKPTAFRAVGAANGANNLPLVVPCHRVIGSDGSLTGFGGGIETKRWLLAFEGASGF